jgi:proliferating cell nuclear antigen PCNA
MFTFEKGGTKIRFNYKNILNLIQHNIYHTQKMHLLIENKSKLEVFVALFSLLKNWSNAIRIQFEESRVYIQTMDKSHVCLSNIIIDKSWFSTYEIQQSNSIVVDALHFCMIVSQVLKNSRLEMKFEDEAEPERLYINLLNNKENKDGYDHFYEIQLIDLDQEVLEIPEVDYDVDMKLETKKMVEMVSELALVGPDLSIVANEDVLEFHAQGDSGKLKINIPIEHLNEYAIGEGSKLNVSYSINHIGKMCLSSKLSHEIELGVSSEYPMSFKYDLGDNSTAVFYVAPKIMD